MDVVLASDRLLHALNSLILMCRFPSFKLNLIVKKLPPSNLSLPSCIHSIVTQHSIEIDLEKQNPGWVPPWSEHYDSKHDTFFNLVRFYIVNITHMRLTDTFVLIDDDVFINTNTSLLVSYLASVSPETAITADCSYWDSHTSSPLTRVVYDTSTFGNWRQWLRFMTEWPYDVRRILNQTWWNFGFTIINRPKWMKYRLSYRFEHGVNLYKRLGFALASIDFGLVLAQVVFAGHVQCLPSSIMNSGLGFSSGARAYDKLFPATMTHFNGDDKPWGVRRSLDSDDDDYNVCVNKNWNQCGGHGYTGVRCCAPGWKCQFINAWYSHCVPDTRSRCRQNSFWSQCGGYHFTGYTCCTTGSNCVKINAWYSQCVPN